jgi:amino acid transporter/nucleotide-binding universal stress UspA family protein
MLFGDWGTSRLYVLGLAFVASAHASFWYVTAMCVLVALVGFAYTIICKHFPDGGGVYSSAKQRSRTLAVIGALLLIADYVVTAALSAYEGFRYMLPDSVDASFALYAALASILLLGGLNVVGPRRVGFLALVVAVISALLYLVIGINCIPTFGHAIIHAPQGSLPSQWSHFVNVILALSGVEAIANMTGVMAEPVAKNSRKAIFVVLLEVIVLNLVMAYAMNALPQFSGTNVGCIEAMSCEQRTDLEDHMVKILANTYVGPWFAHLSSLVFGFLLLSAANTAIGGMVSVQYLLARDKELPSVFTALNRYGVPWMGLITATLVPATVLALVGANTQTLAGLYAIGVVGAITINLVACGTNFTLVLSKLERGVLLGVGTLVAAIEMTIAFEKPAAVMFAGSVLGAGLVARYGAKRVAVPVTVAEEQARKPVTESAIRASIPANAARLLVPTRGHPKLMKFAIDYAKDKGAALFVLFVREVALAFRERGENLSTMTLASDKDAQAIFANARRMCDTANVPMVQLYAVHDSPAELILDHAATLGVDAVLMGVSKRGALWKTLRGDVLQEVIEYLPESIPLLIHA